MEKLCEKIFFSKNQLKDLSKSTVEVKYICE